MIKITSFAKPKQNGTTNVTYSGSRGYANSTSSTTKVKGVYLWGQYHDHTKDITGDLSSVRNINATGNLISNSVSTNNVSTGSLSSYYIDSSEISNSGSLTTQYIDSSYGNFLDISTRNITNSSQITTPGLQVTDHAIINTEKVGTGEFDTVKAVNAIIEYLTSGDITCENLTVTKAAHFFKLVIDEIKASQGQIIITPANATIDYVEDDDAGWKCYFKATDGDKHIYQNFDINDLIVCQTFNLSEGTGYDVSNRYYWRMVEQVSDEITYMDLDGDGVDEEYHWIVLSNTTYDPNSISEPAAGDEIVLLGNLYNKERQNAISIGAYNNPYLDKDLKAPFFVQYQGINDFELEPFRLTYFSNGANSITGTFHTNSGDNIEDLINNITQGSKSYLHIAYADNETGTVGFTKTYTEGKLYMGLCSNYTESDSNLIYSNYTWVRIKGDNGDAEDAVQYTLVPVIERLTVNSDKKLIKSLYYRIVKISGTTATVCTDMPDNHTLTYTEYYLNTVSKGETSFSHSGNVWYLNSTNVDYNTATGVNYIVVKFKNGSTEIDNRIIYATMMASATLSITDQIESKVTGNTQLIDSLTGKVTENTNSISTLTQKYDSISASVESNTTKIEKLGDGLSNANSSIDSLTSSVATNTQNIANLTIQANIIQSTVSSHTTKINTITNEVGDIKSQVTENTTNISDIIQKADEITSTVTEIKEGVRGDNVLEGVGSGYKWVLVENNQNEGEIFFKDPIYQTTGFQFEIPNDKWIDHDEDTFELYSPAISDYTGTYTLSFVAWEDNIQIKIYDIFPGQVEEPSTWYEESLSSAKLRLLQTLNTSSNQVYKDGQEFDSDGNVKAYDGKKLRYSSDLGRYYYTFTEKNSDSKWFGLIFKNTSQTLSGTTDYTNYGSSRYIQQIMVEPGDTPHKFEESYAVNQSLIKQTADNITLDASTVMVKNNGTLSALFENGKIRTNWIGAIGGAWQIDDNGFVYNASDFDNYGNTLSSYVYPHGFRTQIDESLTGGLVQYVTISPYSQDYNIDIMSGSQGAINIDSLRADLDVGISMKHGVICGLRGKTNVELSSSNYNINLYDYNIIINGGTNMYASGTTFGSKSRTLILPDTANTYTNGYSTYYKEHGTTPDTITAGQEYHIWKRTTGTITIATYDSDYYTNILVFRGGSRVTTSGVGSYTIAAAIFGEIKILWDGYYWNMEIPS